MREGGKGENDPMKWKVYHCPSKEENMEIGLLPRTAYHHYSREEGGKAEDHTPFIVDGMPFLEELPRVSPSIGRHTSTFTAGFTSHQVPGHLFIATTYIYRIRATAILYHPVTDTTARSATPIAT